MDSWREPADARMGGRYRTTELKNAHGTEFREVLYPWHPRFGRRVGVHEAIDKPDCIVFRCNLSCSDTDRWLEVPAWMFDRSVCAGVRDADGTHTNMAALSTLAALLRQVLSDRLASSNAPLLSASILSRDGSKCAPPSPAGYSSNTVSRSRRPTHPRVRDHMMPDIKCSCNSSRGLRSAIPPASTNAAGRRRCAPRSR